MRTYIIQTKSDIGFDKLTKLKAESLEDAESQAGKDEFGDVIKVTELRAVKTVSDL